MKSGKYMKRRNYSLNEHSIEVIQNTAEEKQVSQSEALRRIIEFYEEQHSDKKKNRKNQND